jgi:ribonuclease HI
MPSSDRLDHNPAFAIAALSEDHNGQYCTLGFLASQLRHCGTLFAVNYEADSTLTELAGIIYARLWIAIVAPICPVSIFSDSKVSIDILRNYHNPGKYKPLAIFAHAINQYIQASVHYSSSQSLAHVKAHNDQPWNELVDSLAKATATAAFKPAKFPSALVNLVQPSPFHAWLNITQSASDLDAYPPCIDNEFHATSISTHTGLLSTYHREIPAVEVSGFKADPNLKITFRVATHNVMSAADCPSDTTVAFDSVNVCLLSQQYAHHYLHIIGQQESRLPAKQKLSSLYSIVSSGTTAKHGLGCSLWISRFLPYHQIGNKSFCLSMQRLFTVHASPRILVVDVDAPHMRMRLISAHAPIAKCYEAREQHFRSLS